MGEEGMNSIWRGMCYTKVGKSDAVPNLDPLGFNRWNLDTRETGRVLFFERVVRDIIKVCKYLKRRCRGVLGLRSSAQPQDKRWGVQCETQEVPSELQVTLFYSWVVEQWQRLPREVVESASLEVFPNHLNVALGSLVKVYGPRWSRGLVKQTPSDPFHSQPFCDFVTQHHLHTI